MGNILQYEFMRHALMAGVLASVACGVIGTYVVVNRIAFLSGGIAHTAYGGIGLGYFLGISPLFGAVGFSLAGAILIGLIRQRARQRTDTLIGILWAVGMALGILFVRFTPGYAPDLMTYLFGNILTVPRSDLYLMLILDGIILTTVIALSKEFLAISFDEEQALIAGLPVELLQLVLLCLIALTVVLLIRVVGIILVIALLTIPPATSALFTSSLKRMMLLAVVLELLFTFVGLGVAFAFDLPSGATIILVASAGFLLGMTFRRISSLGGGLDRGQSVGRADRPHGRSGKRKAEGRAK